MVVVHALLDVAGDLEDVAGPLAGFVRFDE